MKYFLFILLINISVLKSNSQTLGGYSIHDYLVTAVHPKLCDPNYVTGPPDDSIWVNFFAGDSMTGVFSNPSIDLVGNELLLEGGYDKSNYNVSLLLSNGQYSSIHHVNSSNWISLQNIFWNYLYYAPCATGSSTENQFILPLDYNLDFGLVSTDTVVGIKIVFLQTLGAPDFAGAYIVTQELSGSGILLSNAEFDLYPNPFSEHLNIVSHKIENVDFILYDITGRKIIQEKFTNEAILNTEKLIPGVYIYELHVSNDSVLIGKIVRK